MPDPFIESLEQYLRQGKVEPSCHLLLQLAQRADSSPDAAAKTAIDCLNRMLESFVIEPVGQVCDELQTLVPAEIADPILQTVGKRLAIIRDWAGKMALIGQERQARDLRAVVRARDLQAAEHCVLEMMTPPGGDAPDRSRAEFVGSVLGSIDHGQDEAGHLIENLRSGGKKTGLDASLIDAMDQARVARARAAARSQGEFREAEFVRDLTALVVELKGWLPNVRVSGAPTEEHITRFHEALHAVVASVFIKSCEAQWRDVTAVLVDYCPRELSIVGRRAGAEERAYMTITPTARRTVFEAFGRLGRNEIAVESFLQSAESVEDERQVRNIVEVMGAMRSKPFLPWLEKKLDGESRASVRNTILTAASNFVDGESAQLLLGALARAVRKGKRRGIIPEGPERREVLEAVFALGRVVRSPRMDAAGRNEILKRAIGVLPEKDARVQYELAYQCFRSPAEGWDEPLRAWAIDILTRSFWLGDMTPDFAEGDERQANILGWRGPAAQALVTIGKDAVPAILKTCEENDLRFGGAFLGVAEALGQIGDPRGLDLLERLLAGALLFDDSDRNKYQTEKYYDSTEGVRKELEPDQIVAALLHAIERIGGDRGDAMLVRAFNQIHGSGFSAAGAETGSLLERIRTRIVHEGRWDELQNQPVERGTGPAAGQDKTMLRQAAADALKTLQARIFRKSKRRTEKVKAIQTLAAQRNIEAIPLLVDHLGNSDALISGAAETALSEYAMAAADESIQRALIYALLEGLQHPDDGVRQSIRGILKRLGPGREPLHSKLKSLSQAETNPLLRAEASRLLMEAAEDDLITRLGSAMDESHHEEPPPPEEGGSAPEEKTLEERAPAPATAIDEKYRLKREYIQARRAWIRGGKKGDPPAPPPGMDVGQ